eukprot:m.1639611 g.1639611  ORF g.1639611 m.1639611 type:complete len:53 (-) comp36790_c0_seq1:647-805(-)
MDKPVAYFVLKQSVVRRQHVLHLVILDALHPIAELITSVAHHMPENLSLRGS